MCLLKISLDLEEEKELGMQLVWLTYRTNSGHRRGIVWGCVCMCVRALCVRACVLLYAS